MKKVFWLLTICATISLSAFAGVNQNKGGRRGDFSLPKSLNLTAEQQQKFESLNTTYKAKASELRANTSLTSEQRQAQMKELRDARQKSVNEILTPAQQDQLKEMRSRRGNRPAVPRGNPMESLNLTDAQKEQMKALNDDFRSKSEELRKQHREAINQILTPEQQARMKELGSRFERDGRQGLRRGAEMRGNRSNSERKGMRAELSAENKAKLDSLREGYSAKKKAIEMSRVAPEEQTRRLQELRNQFRTDRRAIIDEARQAKENSQP